MLINDDDLVFLNNIVAVTLENRMGPKRLVDVVKDFHVLGVVNIGNTEPFLDPINTRIGQVYRPRLLVDCVVDIGLQQGNHTVDDVISLNVGVGWP